MKKVTSLFLMLVVSIGLSSTSLAANTSVYDQQEEILMAINEEYSLELGYVESELTVDEYEELVRKHAIQQRELLDYIAMRKKENTEMEPSDMRDVTLSTISKTRTRSVWNYGHLLNITATFNVTGNQVSSLRNASLRRTPLAVATLFNVLYVSSPTYSYIDSGRTGTVRYTGTASYENGELQIPNSVFYTEFPYDS